MVQPVLTPPFVPELGLDEVVARLGRCTAIEEALTRAFGAWLPRVKDPKLPPTVLQHLEQDERHAACLRLRLRELRDTERARGGSRDPDLDAWLESGCRAGMEVEWLAGLYGVVKPVLADAYRDLIAALDPDRDEITRSLVRELLDAEEAQIEWGLAQLRRLATNPAARNQADDWAQYLRLGLRAAGDIWGDMPRQHPPFRPNSTDR